MRLALALAVAAIATACGTARSDAAVRLQRVVSGLQSPLYLTAPPGSHGRLFIVEKGGKIVIDQDGHVLSKAFLNISRLVSNGSEQGLLSMAFDPNYRTNHLFYVSYTNRDGNSRIVRYSRSAHNANRANPNSHRTLLKVHQPFANHNGGDITFGPDGRLYIGFGDGGSEGDPLLNGQKKTGLLSKILSINPRAHPPRPHIYAYGLRNPWRFSFDRKTGDLWIGDVGQNRWEEVDRLRAGTPAGTNFGWSYYEGTHIYKRAADRPLAAGLPGRPVPPPDIVGAVQLLDHRRLCLPRQRHPQPGRRLRLRRPLLGPDLEAAPGPPAKADADLVPGAGARLVRRGAPGRPLRDLAERHGLPDRPDVAPRPGAEQRGQAPLFHGADLLHTPDPSPRG